MTTQAYTITNTTGSPVQMTDANGSPFVAAIGTTSDVLLDTAGLTLATSIFGAANVVLYIAPAIPATGIVYEEGTVATGGTAVSLFSDATPEHGFEIVNNVSTTTLYYREASAATVGEPSSPIAPNERYISPLNYVPTGAISVNSPLTGHSFTARAF